MVGACSNGVYTYYITTIKSINFMQQNQSETRFEVGKHSAKGNHMDSNEKFHRAVPGLML